jgi:nucleoside-diphosphate-sugar epimerase
MSPRYGTVVVTGGSGFIGTNLMSALRGNCQTLVNLDVKAPMDPDQRQFWKPADIMDKDDMLAAFRELKPTQVVHLAARCDCDENTTVGAGYRANTVGTANVLEAIRASPEIRRAVITSTQFVFNKGAELPRDDQDYFPRTVYGQSKIITEKLTREADLPCCWTLVRPTNVWGPWHIRHAEQFFRVLRWGVYVHPGREPVMRCYAFVGNVVDQILRILDAEAAKVNGKTLYLGDPAFDILEWVNGFSQALRGRSVRIMRRPVLRLLARAGDLVSKVTGKSFFITSSRFRSMTESYLAPMDWTFEALGPNKYDLGEGIRQTVAWLQGVNARAC